jgi:ABC-type polysaccharide/polyol phosphate export permease
MAFALSFVFGGLMGVTNWRANFANVLYGVLAWGLVGGVLADAPLVFVSASSLMQLHKLPLSFHVFLLIYRALVNFTAQLILAILIMLLLGVLKVPNITVIPAILLVLLNSTMLSLIIGVPSTRFRDLGHAIGIGMSILFFCTPVFWNLDQMSPNRRSIVSLNPLAHEIDLIRKAFLGHAAPLVDWEWGLATLLITAIMAIVLLAAYRRRIIFWL